jgi:hypothetical protein
MSEHFEPKEPSSGSRPSNQKGGNPQKELPIWFGEITIAHEAFNDTWHRVNQQLEEDLNPFEEEIEKEFKSYINQMSPFLPEAICFGHWHGQRYFLSKSWEFYRVPEFEHPVFESGFGSRESITPESEKFIGWEDARNKHPQLFTKATFVRDHTYGQNIPDTEAEISLINIAQEELNPKNKDDLKIVEAKSKFYEAIKRREEESRRIKEELSPQIKQGVLNIREILIHHFGIEGLPEILEPNWNSTPGSISKAMFFLPREGRLVEASLVKESSLSLEKPKPDLSKAREATEEEWFNFGPDFFGNMIREATGLEPLHIKWRAEGKS